MKCEFCGKEPSSNLDNGELNEFGRILQGKTNFYWLCPYCYEVIEFYDECEPTGIKPKWSSYNKSKAKRLWPLVDKAFKGNALERMLGEIKISEYLDFEVYIKAFSNSLEKYLDE